MARTDKNEQPRKTDSQQQQDAPPKLPNMGLGMVAIAVYIIGGAATFAGVVFWVFYRSETLWGLGTGEAFGYLGICVGLIMTILGVLLMRLFRNHG